MDNQENCPATPLVKAHQDLLKEILKLEAALNVPNSPPPRSLRECLEAIYPILAEHFLFEEQNGYLAFVLEQKPHLERSVNALRDEHKDLQNDLIELLDAIPKGGSAEPFVERAGQWVQRLRNHERQENLLVEDAINQDVGSAD